MKVETTIIGPDPKPLSVRRSLKNVENNLWVDVSEEFRDAEALLQGSSDDDDDDEFGGPQNSKTHDSWDDRNSDMLLGMPQMQTLKELHPSPIHIFRLWQFYLNNVNPLTKILHSPSIQQQILDATSDLEKIPKNIEALMFGIYSMAVATLNEEECRNAFGEEKMILFSRYQAGTRQALINAGYLKSNDIIVLQAFTLYLLSSMQQMTLDPRTLFCLTGITVRIAQRLGLSYDGTAYGLLPIEVEIRRRLWWQIILIDSRVAELSGAGPTVLTYSWQTSIPGNINDSDLFPGTRDPPVEHAGVTEAVFVRIRAEALQLTTRLRSSGKSLAEKTGEIRGFEERVQREYLVHCDASIPLHLMSIMFARLSVFKMRLGLRHPHLMVKKGEVMSAEEKEGWFILCLEILEHYTTALSTPQTAHFTWHFLTSFPFPAIVYLLCSLRYRASPTDTLADRAWAVLEAIMHRREAGSMSRNFQQRRAGAFDAMAQLTLKAWEKREAGLRFEGQGNAEMRVPGVVVKMREVVRGKKGWSSSAMDSSVVAPAAVQEGLGGLSFGDAPFFDQGFGGMDQGFAPELVSGGFTGDGEDDWMFWNEVVQGNRAMEGFDGVGTQSFQS